jgi:hypothetical protein
LPVPYTLPLTGVYPWLKSQYSFVGWVPNVSGHLSFGLICHGGEPLPLNHQIEKTGERAIVVHRRRSAEDFPLPGSFIGRFRRSVTLDYIIAARTATAKTPFVSVDEIAERVEENGVLTGILLVLPRDSDPEVAAKSAGVIEEIDIAIGAAITCATKDEEIAANQLPENIRDRSSEWQKEIACHRVNFALFRTGELRIWFDLDDFLGRDTKLFPTNETERLAAEYLPSQMYFCVKDLVHRHYHHDPHTDQLLDFYRLDTGAENVDDISWRVNTLRGLAKVVVEFRHSDAPTSNKKALGVLAYADAFQSLLAKLARDETADKPMRLHSGVILYDFNHVRASIEALDALNETRRGALLQLFGILVGVVLSAFALWAGAVQIQPILCDAMRTSATPCPKMSPNTAVDLINLIVANPLGFVVVLAVLGFAAFVWAFKGIASVPGAKSLRIWVNRFSSAAATTLSQKLGSDNIGYAAYLTIIGVLTFASGFISYLIVPKTEVPSLEQARNAAEGPWSVLDRFVGKKPGESGLLTSSVISEDLRDLAGEEHDNFMALMTETSSLQRVGNSGVLWVSGRLAGSQSRDAAYLLIDQRNRKLEMGLRQGGVNTVYRSPGAVIKRPPAITQIFDGVAADVRPLAALSPVCKSVPAGSNSRTLVFEGAMPANEACPARISLRRGQIFTFNPVAARGLQLSIGEEGKQLLPITGSFTAERDGVYLVRVEWQNVGGTPAQRAVLRPFYVRARIQ